MLQALGYTFLDGENSPVGHGSAALSQIRHIKEQDIPSVLKECKFQIACDVTNPLYGENGATYIYGPQKALLPEQLTDVDYFMKYYAEMAATFIGKDASAIPGTGAAGGLGFAFLSYLNAEPVPGANLIMDTLNLEKELENAELCNQEGIDVFFPILCDICSLEEALSSDKTAENQRKTAEQVFRLITLYV